MGNRVYLYFGSAAALQAGDGEEIAAAKNHFPAVWRLLLAEGTQGSAQLGQRVFGDQGTPNLVARAEPALARLAALLDGLAQHPLLHRLPLLPLRLQGMLDYLQSLMDALPLAERTDACFSASLDELAWLDLSLGEDDAANAREVKAWVQAQAQGCAALASALLASVKDQRWREAEALLGLSADGGSFDDTDRWDWSAGIGTWQHPYFQGSEWSSQSWAEFAVANDDAPATLQHFGDGLEGFCETLADGPRWGLRRLALANDDAAPSPSTLLCPPQWLALQDAGHPERALIWVQGDDSAWQLADASGDTLHLLGRQRLQQVGSFERITPSSLAPQWACAVLHRDRMGLLGDDGKWRVAPAGFVPPVDELWDFCEGLACARSGDDLGLIDHEGSWCLPPDPSITDIDDANGEGVTVVWRGERGALVQAWSGKVLLEGLSACEWRPDLPGFLITVDQLQGLWHPDGRVWIGPNWRRVRAFSDGGPLLVQDGRRRWGLIDRVGLVLAAPAYDEIDAFPPSPAHPSAAPMLQVRRQGLIGLLDLEGQVLMPVAYTGVERFTVTTERIRDVPQTEQLLMVSRRDGQRTRVGVFNLGTGQEDLRCEHGLLALVVYTPPRGTGTWAYVDSPDPLKAKGAPQQLGLLGPKGQRLHPPEFAWIGAAYSVNDGWGRMMLTERIGNAWRLGQPAEAVHATDDRYLWLHPDGRVTQHRAHLAACFAAGDFKAAYRLAQNLARGEGIDADEDDALRWTALAAGQPEATVNSLWGGLLKRWVNPWIPKNVHPEGLPEAALDLAIALDQRNAEADGRAARAWLELALARSQDSLKGRIARQLGGMLDQGHGGPEDLPGALRLFELGAAQGDASAHFKLGWAHEFARGVKEDLPVALSHYLAAAKGNEPTAHYRAACIHLRLAEEAPNSERRRHHAEALHLLDAACQDDRNADSQAEARAALALMWWHGQGPRHDPAAAKRWLEAGAQANERPSLEALILTVVGPADSPFHNPEDVTRWQSQLAELNAP